MRLLHQGQNDQKARTVPQPQELHLSRLPSIFHFRATARLHQGQYFMNGINFFRLQPGFAQVAE